MSVIATLIERRAALKAEAEAMLDVKNEAGEARDLTDAEDADFSAKLAEIKKVDERIAELQDAEKREAASAAHRVELGVKEPEVRAHVGNEPNPVYRRDNLENSFFKDLFSARTQGDSAATGRLAAAQETRSLSTTANAGGQFAPPLWLIEDFVALARAARVTADLVQHDVLPSGVSSINLPTVATGTTVAVQSTQNSALSQTDATTGSVTSGVTSIGGLQKVSMQLLQQSGIPFDRVILGDLARAYATQVDTQVISGSGSSGQLRGIINGSGITTTTFTSGTPAVTSATAANSFYNKVVSAIASVHTGRYLPPTAIVMHPVRWGWVLEGLDSQVRPLVTPHDYPQFNGVGDATNSPVAQGAVGSLLGLPVFVDPNIPQNLGAGTNEDRVFVMRTDDLWLYESELQTASFDATYADTATILFRVLGYAAFIPDRYGKSISMIGGTGLVTPTL